MTRVLHWLERRTQRAPTTRVTRQRLPARAAGRRRRRSRSGSRVVRNGPVLRPRRAARADSALRGPHRPPGLLGREDGSPGPGRPGRSASPSRRPGRDGATAASCCSGTASASRSCARSGRPARAGPVGLASRAGCPRSEVFGYLASADSVSTPRSRRRSPRQGDGVHGPRPAARLLRPAGDAGASPKAPRVLVRPATSRRSPTPCCGLLDDADARRRLGRRRAGGGSRTSSAWERQPQAYLRVMSPAWSAPTPRGSIRSARADSRASGEQAGSCCRPVRVEPRPVVAAPRGPGRRTSRRPASATHPAYQTPTQPQIIPRR